MGGGAVNAASMESDESCRAPSVGVLALLAREDLGPLSVDELTARIAVLEAEIARTRRQADQAVRHRSAADALFGR